MEAPLRLIREAHRRSLWQVLGIYAVAGWVALQVVQALTASLGLPDWFPALAIILLIVGLPVVLATAFVQEGMGGGGASDAGEPAPTEEARGQAPRQRSGASRFLTWRYALGGGVVAFALWGVVAAGWVLFGGATGVAGGGTEGEERPSIAVLPFVNLSPDPEADQYFADGIHDELLRELSRVAGLRVVSRTSVVGYRGTTKRVPEIAAELGVGTILEATVRRENDRVRLTAQLIDADDDAHLWAETYERDLADIFTVQSDLALSIAREIGARLSPEEERVLGGRPTASVEAYDLYLRARGEWGSGTTVAGRAPRALELLRRATEVDRNFAAAWGLIASIQAVRWVDAYDVTPATKASLETALERALELDPRQPEARLARAYTLAYDRIDLERAEAELRGIIAVSPSFPDAHFSLARLQALRGNPREVSALLSAGMELDPANPGSLFSAAVTLTWIGEYAEAERLHRRALDLDPARLADRFWLADLVVATRGDTAAARALLREAVALDEATAARAFIEGGNRALITLIDDPTRLLQTTSAAAFPSDPLSQAWYGHDRAAAALLDGNTEQARLHARAAMAPLEEFLAADGPRDIQVLFRMELGWILALLGDRERALAELSAAEEQASSLGAVAFGPRYVRSYLAEAYALLGEAERALALAATLDEPGRGRITRNAVRHLFPWVLLRGDPSYEAFLAGDG